MRAVAVETRAPGHGGRHGLPVPAARRARAARVADPVRRRAEIIASTDLYAIDATSARWRDYWLLPHRYLDEKRFSLRRAHLCDVRVCRFEGRDHVVRLASAAREGPRLLQKVSDCRVCCESQEEAWAMRRAILGKAHGGKQLPVDNDEDRAAAELCRAAGAGDLERVEELLASGEATAEDANGAGESAVSRAVRFAIQTARGRDRLQMARALKCVAVLMENGADPFAASCLGASARDVLEAARGEVPDAIIDTIRRELDRAAIVATADGALVALTEKDANRARELIRRREARESRARRYAETGWTAEDERLEAEDNAEADAADPLYGVKLRRYPATASPRSFRRRTARIRSGRIEGPSKRGTASGRRLRFMRTRQRTHGAISGLRTTRVRRSPGTRKRMLCVCCSTKITRRRSSRAPGRSRTPSSSNGLARRQRSGSTSRL